MQVADTDERLRGASRRRLVIIADNSLIIEAIYIGLRKSGEFNVVGYADGRKTSAGTIVGAEPDVVLLDDMGRCERATEIISGIRSESEQIAVIVLTVRMDPDWLGQMFAAGAVGAISKTVHPDSLTTLLRETLNGHVFHPLARRHAGSEFQAPGAPEDLPLTGRELEILRLVAEGLSNGEVAQRVWVTEQTVKFHLRNIYRKLDVANRTEASHYAHVNGLVAPDGEAGSSGELPSTSKMTTLVS
jgi:DNA-binding NarL/FixJ family response regulator